MLHDHFMTLRGRYGLGICLLCHKQPLWILVKMLTSLAVRESVPRLTSKSVEQPYSKELNSAKPAAGFCLVLSLGIDSSPHSWCVITELCCPLDLFCCH